MDTLVVGVGFFLFVMALISGAIPLLIVAAAILACGMLLF